MSTSEIIRNVTECVKAAKLTAQHIRIAAILS